MSKKIILVLLMGIALIYLSFSGIFFNGLLFHEFIHLKQSPNPQDICYSIGTKNWAYVSHEFETKGEITAFEIYSEKWATLGRTYLQYLLLTLFSVSISLLFIYFIWERKR